LKHPAGFWQQIVPAVHAAPLLHEQALATHSSPTAHCTPPQVQSPVPALHEPPEPHSVLLLQPQYFCVKGPRSQSSPPLHVLTQPPQFTVLTVTLSSQPLSGPIGGLVQLAKPGSHAESHKPPEQLFEATFALEQARPHAPQ
jgi:hypothetical protein